LGNYFLHSFETAQCVVFIVNTICFEGSGNPRECNIWVIWAHIGTLVSVNLARSCHNDALKPSKHLRHTHVPLMSHPCPTHVPLMSHLRHDYATKSVILNCSWTRANNCKWLSDTGERKSRIIQSNGNTMGRKCKHSSQTIKQTRMHTNTHAQANKTSNLTHNQTNTQENKHAQTNAIHQPRTGANTHKESNKHTNKYTNK
jgi:hypothetical protein